ncbi:MAG TPA: histidine phosphatase family protein [Caulobacteraceae bacterium]|jgi:probable phosphoglycerate mutase|nr:histidine phosphatase family protein [Caulobacteraceae bacterium]
MGTRVLLIRHGDVEGLVPARFRGRRDVPLSALGDKHVKACARRVARTWKVAAIYASPLQRCLKTAARISRATGVEARPLQGLLDIDYGDWTWRTHEEMVRDQPELWRIWRETPDEMRFPGGESLADMSERATAALRTAAEAAPESCIALVSHDAVVRALVIQSLGLSLRLYHRLTVAPASITELDLARAGPELVRLSDTGHIEP